MVVSLLFMFWILLFLGWHLTISDRQQAVDGVALAGDLGIPLKSGGKLEREKGFEPLAQIRIPRLFQRFRASGPSSF